MKPSEMLLPDKPKKTSSEAIIDGDTAPSSLMKKVGNVAIAELEKNIAGQQQQNAMIQSVIAGKTETKKETTELKDIQSDSNGLEFIVEKRDIILENDINNQQYCMPSIEVKFLKGEGSLFFSDLIERLKGMNFPLNNCMLFCWDEKRGMHVFVANDPIPQPHFLPAHLCGIANSIYIKFRSYQQQSIQPTQRAISYSQQSYNNNNLNKQQINQQNNNSGVNNISNSIASSNNNNNNMNTSMLSNNSQIIKEEDLMLSEDNSLQGDMQSKRNKKMMLMGGNSSNSLMRGGNNNNMNASDKRVKERYIEKVREKVSEWRAMHETGFRDKDGNIQKLNLDHAANYIGISRKTLDDYYLQLRRAEQLGFDFDRNKSEKMGALRKFVKEESKRQSRRSPAMQNNNVMNNSMSNNANNSVNNSINYGNLMNSNINNNNANNNIMNSSNLSSNHNTNNMFNMNANLSHFVQMGESDEDNEQSSQDMMSHGHNPRSNQKNLTGLQYINSLQSNTNSIHNNNSMASIIKSVHSSNNNNNMGSIGGLGNMSSVCSSGSGGSVNLLSKNSIQSFIGTSVQNPLMAITQQQSSYLQPRNSSTLLTPYNCNHNNPSSFNQSGGPFYLNNNNNPNNQIMGGSNLQNSNANNSQGNSSQVLLQAYQSRGSYMMNEGMDNSTNNLASIQNNQQNPSLSLVNKPFQRNSMNGTQLFNPGSSFISQTNPSGFQNNSALHNLELNNSNQNQLPSSEIQVEQRFSNQFSLMQLGNASQIIEERNSFNFLNSGLSINNNNINNPSENINNNNRLSNSSLFQMTEDNNYINSNNNVSTNNVGSSKSMASIIANQINGS